jgi:hypothetical protein
MVHAVLDTWSVGDCRLVPGGDACGAAGPTDSSPSRTTHLTTTLSPATLSALQSHATSAQATKAGDAGGTSFFKTKKGAAVIVLLGAGFGYALYSKSHDRVLSPIR